MKNKFDHIFMFMGPLGKFQFQFLVFTQVTNIKNKLFLYIHL